LRLFRGRVVCLIAIFVYLANVLIGVVAKLEDTNNNLVIRMESTAPGMVMVSDEFVDHTEFLQKATFGFNIKKAWLDEFLKQMDFLLAQAS